MKRTRMRTPVKCSYMSLRNRNKKGITFLNFDVENNVNIFDVCVRVQNDSLSIEVFDKKKKKTSFPPVFRIYCGYIVDNICTYSYVGTQRKMLW